MLFRIITAFVLLVFAAAMPVFSAELADEVQNADAAAKACVLMTSDCEVCTITEDGMPVCSSQGIACVPTERRCLVQAQQPP